jgi:hypothetical protein
MLSDKFGEHSCHTGLETTRVNLFFSFWNGLSSSHQSLTRNRSWFLRPHLLPSVITFLGRRIVNTEY